jgi:hypothetical protein
VSVQRSATLQGDANAILEMAASNAGYQRFNPYKNENPDLKVELFGPASGVGSGFTFNTKDTSGSQVVSAVDGHSVSYAIDLGAMGKPSACISVAPGDVSRRANDGSSHVTWRTDMDLGFNPVARVFGLFMDRMLGKTFETGLRNIEMAVAASR